MPKLDEINQSHLERKSNSENTSTSENTNSSHYQTRTYMTINSASNLSNTKDIVKKRLKNINSIGKKKKKIKYNLSTTAYNTNQSKSIIKVAQKKLEGIVSRKFSPKLKDNFFRKHISSQRTTSINLKKIKLINNAIREIILNKDKETNLQNELKAKLIDKFTSITNTLKEIKTIIEENNIKINNIFMQKNIDEEAGSNALLLSIAHTDAVSSIFSILLNLKVNLITGEYKSLNNALRAVNIIKFNLKKINL